MTDKNMDNMHVSDVHVMSINS